jgi:hypothetical protein
VNLLTLYHDSVLIRKQRQEIIKANPNSKQNDSRFKLFPTWWEAGSITLTSITAVQLFIEIFARSKHRRWHAIFSVELVKYVKIVFILFQLAIMIDWRANYF